MNFTRTPARCEGAAGPSGPGCPGRALGQGIGLAAWLVLAGTATAGATNPYVFDWAGLTSVTVETQGTVATATYRDVWVSETGTLIFYAPPPGVTETFPAPQTPDVVDPLPSTFTSGLYFDGIYSSWPDSNLDLSFLPKFALDYAFQSVPAAELVTTTTADLLHTYYAASWPDYRVSHYAISGNHDAGIALADAATKLLQSGWGSIVMNPKHPATRKNQAGQQVAVPNKSASQIGCAVTTLAMIARYGAMDAKAIQAMLDNGAIDPVSGALVDWSKALTTLQKLSGHGGYALVAPARYINDPTLQYSAGVIKSQLADGSPYWAPTSPDVFNLLERVMVSQRAMAIMQVPSLSSPNTIEKSHFVLVTGIVANARTADPLPLKRFQIYDPGRANFAREASIPIQYLDQHMDERLRKTDFTVSANFAIRWFVVPTTAATPQSARMQVAAATAAGNSYIGVTAPDGVDVAIKRNGKTLVAGKDIPTSSIQVFIDSAEDPDAPDYDGTGGISVYYTNLPDGNYTFEATSGQIGVARPFCVQLGGAAGVQTSTTGTTSATTGKGTLAVAIGGAANSRPKIAAIAAQTTKEDTTTPAIAVKIADAETAATALTLSGTSSDLKLVPVAGITFGGSGANRTVRLKPALNRNGTATITLTVSDGSLTTSTSFKLTVTAVNDAPTMSAISNHATNKNTVTKAIAFKIADAETAATKLVLTKTSSNPNLLPTANIIFGGSGTNRTVVLKPATNRTGTAKITLTVSDGKLSASRTFTLTVNAPPTITRIANQTVAKNGTTAALTFKIGDAETAVTKLKLTKASSNTKLLPLAGIVFGGSGANRTVKVTPAKSLTGSAKVTLTASDGVGTASTTFWVTVK